MGDHPPPPGLPIPPPACCPNCVGARRCLARRASGAATSVPATIPGGLRTPPWAPGRAAGSGPAGPAGQASPPGKSAHLGGARRRVACRTSVARQMGRHILDDADQCAAQPPHHRLPGRVLGVPTGSVTVRGENHRVIPRAGFTRLPDGASRRRICFGPLRGVMPPRSPLQGACGFSPGLQPRAHSSDGGDCRPLRAGGSGIA